MYFYGYSLLPSLCPQGCRLMLDVEKQNATVCQACFIFCYLFFFQVFGLGSGRKSITYSYTVCVSTCYEWLLAKSQTTLRQEAATQQGCSQRGIIYLRSPWPGRWYGGSSLYRSKSDGIAQLKKEKCALRYDSGFILSVAESRDKRGLNLNVMHSVYLKMHVLNLAKGFKSGVVSSWFTGGDEPQQ